MSKDIDPIQRLKDLALEEAENRRLSAGHSGRMDDGGASILEMQVKFYTYGENNLVPPEWKQFVVQLDPEWDEYLRLKKKFGGK